MPSDVDGDICPEKPVNSEGKVIDDGEVTVSRVHWNRFGNVVTSRYVNEYEIDPGTGDKKWACDNEAPKYVYD